MNEELFEELLQSVREGGAILRGEKEASRTFVIETPNVKDIRERYELSQTEFAVLLGISVKTLQKNLASLLEKALREGAVRVKRKDGQTFIIVPETREGSPLDVEGIDLDLTKEEIIQFIHEGRKYS